MNPLKVSILEYTNLPESLCGMAAAVCTDARDPIKSLQHALESGHTSVLEHAVFTFEVEGLSRAALAQLTRHRLASFDVQSQRYVKLGDWTAVIPERISNSYLAEEAEKCIQNCMDLYERLLEAGVPAEDARYITPQAISTKLIMTMNARELIHFCSLRTCNRAQWEIRHMADEMLRICRRLSPLIFGNAGPGCVTGKCPEKRPCGHARNIHDWDS